MAQQAIEPTSMEVDEVEEEGEVSDVEPDSKEEKHVVLDEDIAPTVSLKYFIIFFYTVGVMT